MRVQDERMGWDGKGREECRSEDGWAETDDSKNVISDRSEEAERGTKTCLFLCGRSSGNFHSGAV